MARARRERLLNELSLELSASLDPRRVLDSACARICSILEASGCEIWAQLEEGTIECLAAWVGGEAVEDWVGRRLPVAEWAVSRVAIESGETLVVGSVDDPRLGEEERAVMREWDQRFGPGHAAARPRPHPGHARDHADRTRACLHRRGGRDGRVLRAADGLAIDNATLYERKASTPSASLAARGRPRVTSSLVIRDVLAALVRTAATSLSFPEALIFEYDAEADTMTMRSVYQEVPTVYEGLDQPYPLSEYPSDRAAAGERRHRRGDDLRP